MVAIPVFNRRDLVLRAIDSALAQQVGGLEVLVVDNCSDDGTWEALQALRDPRLRLARNDSNLGLFGNFNRCLELGEAQYLRFLCSDDRLTPGCLARETAIMDAHPSVAMLSSAGRFVDRSGNPGRLFARQLAPGVYPGEQAIACWFRHFSRYGQNPLNYPSGVLFRRAAALLAGRFDAAMRSVGDVDFYMRVLAHGELAVSADIGCEVMLHAEQESRITELDGSAMRELLACLERQHARLQSSGEYAIVRRGFSAYALDIALRCRLRGQRDAARAHFDLAAAAGAGSVALAATWLRMNALRAIGRVTGLRPAGMPRPRPLRAAS